MKIIGYLAKGAAEVTDDIFVYSKNNQSFITLQQHINVLAQQAHMKQLPINTVAVLEDDCGNRKAIWRKKHSFITGTHIKFTLAKLPRVINVNGVAGRKGDAGEWLVYAHQPAIL